MMQDWQNLNAKQIIQEAALHGKTAQSYRERCLFAFCILAVSTYNWQQIGERNGDVTQVERKTSYKKPKTFSLPPYSRRKR